MAENCCNKTNSDGGVLRGVLYGIVPHTFCIAFIIFSVVGAVSLTVVFKKILLFPYFFQILVVFSIVMATFSAIMYLKRNKCLCASGIKEKWRYLTILYGLTIFINMFMFYGVFPVLVNINSHRAIVGQTAILSATVQIPCSGHASLIIDELKKDLGVQKVVFEMPNKFDINYNPSLTNSEKIQNLDIFKTYKFTPLYGG